MFSKQRKVKMAKAVVTLIKRSIWYSGYISSDQRSCKPTSYQEKRTGNLNCKKESTYEAELDKQEY